MEGKSQELIAAVAKILQVPASQVSMNTIGQSTLLNHQVKGGESGLLHEEWLQGGCWNPKRKRKWICLEGKD